MTLSGALLEAELSKCLSFSSDFLN